MSKVETFKFETLSHIFGRIGGLYSMVGLLSSIGLMYFARKSYLQTIAVDLREERPNESREDI